MQSVIQKEAEQPLRVAYERRNRDLDPQLWSDLVGSRSNMRDEERCQLTPFTIKRPGNPGQSGSDRCRSHGGAVLDGELAGPGGVDLPPSFQARIIVTASTGKLRVLPPGR